MKSYRIALMLACVAIVGLAAQQTTPSDPKTPPLVGSAATPAAPTLTREEALLQQVATLQMQLAQTQAGLAKCEADGPTSMKSAQGYQATMQELSKSLDARGLMLDPQTGAVKAKPAEKPTTKP